MIRSALARILVVVFVLAPLTLLSQDVGKGYHSFAALTEALQSLQSEYPDIVQLESIGKTLQGRDVWVVALRKGDPGQDRAMLIVGGVDPTQLSGTELSLKVMEQFARAYGTVDSVTQLLNSTTVYIIPMASPDASEMFFSSVRHASGINAHPMDSDRDGSVDEDGVEDLNGDGLITSMRIKDPLGEWIQHPDDSRIMRKTDASRDERGSHRMYSEGIDNDKDEKWNEDPLGGVNFNRNFTFNYEFFREDAGVYQISEPETRAVADFVLSHPSIAVVFSFSPNDNLMKAWKSAARPGGESRVVSSVQKGDEDYYQFIAKRFQDISGLADAPQPEKGVGAFSEWAYYHAGRWSFSTNPWWAPVVKDIPDSTEGKKGKGGKGAGTIRGSRSEESDDLSSMQLRTATWYEKAGMDQVMVPWKTYKHPDFPGQEVEIGGLNPFALYNPPLDSLSEASVIFASFLSDLASRLPRVSWENVKVEGLRSGVYRLTADVVNNGYFPTNNVLGDRIRWVRDVAVTLELAKGQSLASGKARQVLDPIAGNGAKNTLSWVIIAPPGSRVTLSAGSPTSGKATSQIDLR